MIDEHYFPNGNEWIAGENVTVADFAYVATISSLVVSIPFIVDAASSCESSTPIGFACFFPLEGNYTQTPSEGQETSELFA